MRHFRWAVAVLAAAVSAAVGSAQPQPTGPPPPAFGSYLNLLNGSGRLAGNYFGIIRPQQQMAQQLNLLSQQQRQLNLNQQMLGQELGAAEQGIYGQSVYGYNRALRSTGGYIPTFNNTAHYFNTNPALGAGGGGGSRSGGGFGGQVGGGGLGGGQMGPRAPFAGSFGVAGAGVGAARSGAGGGGGVRR